MFSLVNSVVNMTLPAFAAERRRLLSIDISCPRGAQQQTRRTPLLLSNDGTDRRMDAETDGRSNINFGALRGIVQIISYEVKISLVMIKFYFTTFNNKYIKN